MKSWFDAVYLLALALGLAWWLRLLLESRYGVAPWRGAAASDEEADVTRTGRSRLALFFILALFCSMSLAWSGSGPLGGRHTLGRLASCAAAAAAAFIAASGSLASAGLGLVCALLFCAMGTCASLWVVMAGAIARLGTGFAGGLIGAALPLVFALSLAFAAAALLHPDFRGVRGRAIIAVLLLWAAPTVLAHWRLRSAWGFGPETLGQAAAAADARSAPRVAVLTLLPGAAADWSGAEISQAVDGMDASPANLMKIYAYLRRHGFRSIFIHQALSVVRRGWLLWWEADRALEAACLSAPGLFPPDYLTALALIRAGPLTTERFVRLERLHEQALASSAGFEEIKTSQLEFEAFAAAFARYDEEPRALYWLSRIENLWAVSERRAEVTPLQSLADGVISGRVFLDARPARAVRVGLFLEVERERAGKSSFLLSSSVFPNSRGEFRFARLGMGRYHLRLQGPPSLSGADIAHSPGVIDITPSEPRARLATIQIATRGRRPPAAARDWLRAEPQAWGESWRPRGAR